MKKQTYTPPKTDILELNYADPVCQAASGQVPDYEYNPLNPGSLFPTSII